MAKDIQIPTSFIDQFIPGFSKMSWKEQQAAWKQARQKDPNLWQKVQDAYAAAGSPTGPIVPVGGGFKVKIGLPGGTQGGVQTEFPVDPRPGEVGSTRGRGGVGFGGVSFGGSDPFSGFLPPAGPDKTFPVGEKVPGGTGGVTQNEGKGFSLADIPGAVWDWLKSHPKEAIGILIAFGNVLKGSSASGKRDEQLEMLRQQQAAENAARGPLRDRFVEMMLGGLPRQKEDLTGIFGQSSNPFSRSLGPPPTSGGGNIRGLIGGTGIPGGFRPPRNFVPTGGGTGQGDRFSFDIDSPEELFERFRRGRGNRFENRRFY